MQTEIVTTPFGRRPMTLALLKGQLKAADIEPSASVDKWKIFRNICEARDLIGVTDRALSVLNALLSFHPDANLGSGKSLIVFPSNAQLTLRAHGITGTTLRRHIAVLIECGLITRKDSSNGKRYAYKDRTGKIEEAFGFNLSPLLARDGEFSRLAEQVVEDRRAFRVAKERLSICRRDMRKLLAAAAEENIAGDWSSIQTRFDVVLSRMPRHPAIADIAAATAECQHLREETVNLLETQLNSETMAINDVQTERHLQNTETYTIIENGSHENEVPAEAMTMKPAQAAMAKTLVTLPLVLKACPQICDYGSGGGIASWQDLKRAAFVVSLMLGVSPSAYHDACLRMGGENAAVAIACILERGGLVNSAGGYLRDLTRRAEGGKFSLAPMLMALLRVKRGDQTSGSVFTPQS